MLRRVTLSPILRIELESFNKLLEFIKENLEMNLRMVNLRGGPTIPEVCIFCKIRWLACASFYLNIIDITGASTPSFYHVVWKTCKAILNSPELQVKLPEKYTSSADASRRWLWCGDSDWLVTTRLPFFRDFMLPITSLTLQDVLN